MEDNEIICFVVIVVGVVVIYLISKHINEVIESPNYNQYQIEIRQKFVPVSLLGTRSA